MEKRKYQPLINRKRLQTIETLKKPFTTRRIHIPQELFAYIIYTALETIYANKLSQYLGFFLFALIPLTFFSQHVRNLQALKEQDEFFFFFFFFFPQSVKSKIFL